MRGDMTTALELIRAYWGEMLKFGATTFWEDFDIDWTKNAAPIDEIVPEDKDDIHGDFGKFCYEKFRHSLCHGWASGPAPFLSQYVLGITPAEPGFRKVNINPNLGDLKSVNGTYPTPHGVIKVEYTVKDGKVEKKIELPDGVKLA
jgi:alpha-L-rhamnosidase